MMIAGLPEELLDALSDAWAAGDRGRVEVILHDMKRLQFAKPNTRKAVELAFKNPDDLDAMIELAKQKSNRDGQWPNHVSLLIESLNHEFRKRMREAAYPGDGLHVALKTLDRNKSVDFELLATITLYRAGSIMAVAV